MRPDLLLSLRHTLSLAIGMGVSSACESPFHEGEWLDGPAGGPNAGFRAGHPEDLLAAPPGENICDPRNSRPRCAVLNENYNECELDSDCHDGAFAKCVQSFGQIGSFCECDYSCRVDSDCAAGEVCACGDVLGGGRHAMCVPATCKVDADCESGACDVSIYTGRCATDIQLQCRTDEDACASDEDCVEGEQCVFDGLEGRWNCLGITCIIGRPLTIEGQTRAAPPVGRADWLAALDIGEDVPSDVAVALVAHWSRVAALEHASVASFARFTLELMALGAPPELLAEAQRAASDEIRHAQIAWSLASAWARRELGPGPLPLAGLGIRNRVADIVRDLVKEGCVGETLGAAEAEALAAASGHPTMVPLLRTIAQDEARHAALAWRCLRWLLAIRPEDARPAAISALAEARAELAEPTAHAESGPSAPTWGLLPTSELINGRREAFAMIVAPLFRDILTVASGSMPH
ncbi:ferritin-like domain-containing protein [Nannocystis pusilla]|uniref:ferritin-like domain-containing protein n=1 Tax=Nannocystis pusilla TaxID=889268 RepID=UPI003DA60547